MFYFFLLSSFVLLLAHLDIFLDLYFFSLSRSPRRATQSATLPRSQPPRMQTRRRRSTEQERTQKQQALLLPQTRRRPRPQQRLARRRRCQKQKQKQHPR